MSLVIHYEPVLSTNNAPDAECNICMNGFKRHEPRWTHVDPQGNGQKHNPFHQDCLINWLQQGNESKCPYDETLIDLNCLIRKTSNICEKTLVNVAVSAAMGAASVGVVSLSHAIEGELLGKGSSPLLIPIMLTAAFGGMSAGVEKSKVALLHGFVPIIGMVINGKTPKNHDLIEIEFIVYLSATLMYFVAANKILDRLKVARQDRSMAIPIGIYAGITAGALGLTLGLCDPTSSMAVIPAVAGVVSGALTWHRLRA